MPNKLDYTSDALEAIKARQSRFNLSPREAESETGGDRHQVYATFKECLDKTGKVDECRRQHGLLGEGGKRRRRRKSRRSRKSKRKSRRNKRRKSKKRKTRRRRRRRK